MEPRPGNEGHIFKFGVREENTSLLTYIERGGAMWEKAGVGGFTSLGHLSQIKLVILFGLFSGSPNYTSRKD